MTGRDGERFSAVILDLDGVVTRTADLHALAWKQMFDDFLKARPDLAGGRDRPFDADSDYKTYVDGKPRYDGVASFLASRGVELPWGTPDDPPGTDTIRGLGDRKNEIFHRLIQSKGVATFPDAIEQIRRWREQEMPMALVTSSRNGAEILERAGLRDYFEVTIDGVLASSLGLEGKPSPATFLEAARSLGVEPARSMLVEDAVAGIAAGRRGGFGRVVGVAREGGGGEDALRRAGADIVVSDLRDLDSTRS